MGEDKVGGNKEGTRTRCCHCHCVWRYKVGEKELVSPSCVKECHFHWVEVRMRQQVKAMVMVLTCHLYFHGEGM